MWSDPLSAPRATAGRAPDVFTPGGWVPMREHREDEPVDFAIVGTGAGGGTLAALLAEQGFSVVAFDAGAYFRPLDDFASDETAQEQLYWNDRRVVGGTDPVKMGGNNSGKAVGGSTVHYAMVALRFRPEWFKARSLLGYGADWPIGWEEMWHWYGEAERQLSIAGPLAYPWGPKRPRYPYRAHELNGAGKLLARGAEATGITWSETPLATLSAPHSFGPGMSPPCVYRGFCRFGCSTNAKRSSLTVFLPRALAAGAEIRDLAMVGRIETGNDGMATGVHYHRGGAWRFQKARNVVVAGYAVETPRLLLASADHGLGNSSGLVGKNFMTQSNAAVWGRMDAPVRWYKGPPSLAITEHWNYCDDKDFHGGYLWLGQGPLPIEWASVLTSARGLWGQPLRDAMRDYNHMIGVKMVGECLPDERNTVTLADDVDQYGLRVAKVTFGWGQNDKALIDHSLVQMRASINAIGAHDVFEQPNDSNHLGGTVRMGDDPAASVVDADGRSWDVPNLWVCDGSVFPTVGGVNPSLTIYALAVRMAHRIGEMNRRGDLHAG